MRGGARIQVQICPAEDFRAFAPCQEALLLEVSPSEAAVLQVKDEGKALGHANQLVLLHPLTPSL